MRVNAVVNEGDQDEPLMKMLCTEDDIRERTNEQSNTLKVHHRGEKSSKKRSPTLRKEKHNI